jgi:hypothetical protein
MRDLEKENIQVGDIIFYSNSGFVLLCGRYKRGEAVEIHRNIHSYGFRITKIKSKNLLNT